MTALTKFLTVELNSASHRFVLYEGMEVPELVSLLRCAFKLVLDTLPLTNAWIMGLEDDYGTVIPLAMVCKRPMELSAQSVYRLVVSGDPPRLALPVPPGMVEDTLSADLERAHLEMFAPSELPPPPLRGSRLNRTASAVTVDTEAALPGDHTVGSFGESDSLETGENEDRHHGSTSQGDGGGMDEHSAQEEAVVGALRSFAAECGAAGLFTPAEQAALANLLGNGNNNNNDDDDASRSCDPVVRAAYLVAYDSGRDAQLLYAVLKDQASKQLSGDGREEHVAQEELIDMVESLVDGDQITDQQALFLFGLVVRKAASVVALYSAFADHCDEARVLCELVQLAHQSGPAPEEEEGGGRQVQRQSSSRSKNSGDAWEVASMDTVDSGDEISTPRSAAQRQKASSQPFPTTRAGLASAMAQPLGNRSNAPGRGTIRIGDFRSNNDNIDAHSAACTQELMQCAQRMVQQGRFASEADVEVCAQLIDAQHPLLRSGHAAFAFDGDATALEDRILAVVRAERERRHAVASAHLAHDEPSWAALPKDLLNLLQVAEAKGVVGHDDAILVCNAFVHDFELVHAGWEVFEQDGDHEELLDTLVRILKSGRLHRQMDAFEAQANGEALKEDDDDEEDESSVDSEDSDENDPGFDEESEEWEAVTSSDGGSGSSSSARSFLPAQAVASVRTIAGRLEASGVLSSLQGDALQGLADAGAPVVHAAFEVYAADRDLDALLDTLVAIARNAAAAPPSKDGGGGSGVNAGDAPFLATGGNPFIAARKPRSPGAVAPSPPSQSPTKRSSNNRSNDNDEGETSILSPAGAPARGASNIRRADAIARPPPRSPALSSSDDASDTAGGGAFSLKANATTSSPSSVTSPGWVPSVSSEANGGDAATSTATTNASTGEEDAARSGATTELLELLKCLVEDGRVTPREAAALHQLLLRGEPRLLGAYDAYGLSRDVDDLVDTLQRVGKLATTSAFFDDNDDDDSSDDEAEEEDRRRQQGARDPFATGSNGYAYGLQASEESRPPSRKVSVPDHYGPRPVSAKGYSNKLSPRHLANAAAAGAGGVATSPNGDTSFASSDRASVRSDEVAPPSSVSSRWRSLEGFSESDDDEDDDYEDEDEDVNNALELGLEERKELLLLMLDKGVLEHHQAVSLMRQLLVGRTPGVAAAFNEFESSQDGVALVSQLTALADEPEDYDEAAAFAADDDDDEESERDEDEDVDSDSDPEATAAAMKVYAKYAADGAAESGRATTAMGKRAWEGADLRDEESSESEGSSEDVNEEDDDDESEDDDDDESSEADDVPDAREFRWAEGRGVADAGDDDDSQGEGSDKELAAIFMSVVQGMALSEHESAALRLCIARDDPNVRAALEVFKLERDTDDLRDTLRRVARQTVEGAVAAVQAEKH